MKRRLEDIDEVCIARFAVIEEKLETIIAELNKIGKIVPYTIIEHTERIEAVSYTHLDVYKRQVLTAGFRYR